MKWLALAVGIGAAIYFGWVSIFPSVTVRYRLTLELTVDDQPISGSGVIEVTRSDTTAIRSMGGFGYKINGEAVAVDLGPRGQLFALLRGRTIGLSEDVSFPPYVVLEAFSSRLDKRAGIIEKMRELNKLQPKAELPSALLPMLVRFRDIKDPRSVEGVSPDNLAASFGPGVRLRRATIEITRDRVTTGIGQTLPWLDELDKRGGALDGTRFPDNNRLVSRLGSLSFRRRGL